MNVNESNRHEKDDLTVLSISPDVDRAIHEPARFNLMAQLYVVESADFTFLLNRMDMTQGNLSSHLGKLENAGYIEVEKTFKGKRPLTILKMTEKGRSAFRVYTKQMKEVFEKMPG